MSKQKKKLMMVERHVITKSNPHYKMLSDFCKMSKNLYNHANYIVRHEFICTQRWVRYGKLDEILKSDTDYPDYRNMPTAQSAQQCLRLLDSMWKSYFASIKDYAKHKEKYLGKPKFPKYLRKNARYILVLTNQNCKLIDNEIVFPKGFNGFTVTTKCTENPLFTKFQQIRIVPHRHRLVVEVIYAIKDVPIQDDNGRCIGIDIGVNNLAAVSNNIGETPFVINGRPLKSINQFYNKISSHYKEIAKRMNDLDFTERLRILTDKRKASMDDYMHKASRYIVNYCLKYDIRMIIIGKNDLWKQNCKFRKKDKQSFVQIPFARFIEMIQYKAKNVGIAVILTEEGCTSGTSFIDDEEPTREFYNKSRRVKRGLFISNQGIKINADLNGAYQIMRKVVPMKWDSGCALHPVVVNIA